MDLGEGESDPEALPLGEAHSRTTSCCAVVPPHGTHRVRPVPGTGMTDPSVSPRKKQECSTAPLTHIRRPAVSAPSRSAASPGAKAAGRCCRVFSEQ
ncbi:hypothetical protein SHIRM173S_02401 [Streptomyces hirsutus]